jgi:hypothetical protein
MERGQMTKLEGKNVGIIVTIKTRQSKYMYLQKEVFFLTFYTEKNRCIGQFENKSIQIL